MLTPVVGATFQTDAWRPRVRRFHLRRNRTVKDEDQIASSVSGAHFVTPAITRSAPTTGAISTLAVSSGCFVQTGNRPFGSHCVNYTSDGGMLRKRLCIDFLIELVYHNRC